MSEATKLDLGLIIAVLMGIALLLAAREGKK